MTPSDVERIDVPVAAFIVPIVCEPVAEKFAPASDSHGRVSLQYSLAEALHAGGLGRHAYSADSLRHPEILALARRVRYHVDPDFPGPGRFKGAVHVVLKDGRTFDEVEEYNRGLGAEPDDVPAKSAASSARTRARSCQRPRATAWPTKLARSNASRTPACSSDSRLPYGPPDLRYRAPRVSGLMRIPSGGTIRAA